MIVERQDDEILIRISASRNIEEIQTLLNYLKYEELTSRSVANEEDAQELYKKAKKGRYKNAK